MTFRNSAELSITRCCTLLRTLAYQRTIGWCSYPVISRHAGIDALVGTLSTIVSDLVVLCLYVIYSPVVYATSVFIRPHICCKPSCLPQDVYVIVNTCVPWSLCSVYPFVLQLILIAFLWGHDNCKHSMLNGIADTRFLTDGWLGSLWKPPLSWCWVMSESGCM